MGNYISIIIGCVGAVELITFLHQFTLRADQEHDRELEEEARGNASASASATEPQLVAHKAAAATEAKAPASQLSKVTSRVDVPPTVVEEPVLVKTVSQPVESKGMITVHSSVFPCSPEIRFELYERSCSLSDVNRPLVDGLRAQRPLVRDDGSGRRNTIRKRYSSGSIDVKATREEEVRMFTSLEEEEFSSISHNRYVPISYGGGSNTESSSSVVHPRRHRRFKRSPVKEPQQQQLNREDHSSSSREVIDDAPLLEDPAETVVSYPWGDIKPGKHRRHHNEKSMSIEELQEEEERLGNANDEVIAAIVAHENVRVHVGQK